MLKQFYEKVLPSQGVYCVSAIDKNKKITNRFAESLDDLLSIIEKQKAKESNVFVAPGSFDGHSRRSEHSAFLRSFFIDLDVGETKAYDSKQDALDAIDYLVSESGLPPPVRVDSGGGIHAYWIFDEDVPATEWKPYAEKFKAAVQQYIPIDPAVTSDVSRIMRCPYTVNYKYSPPYETKVIDSTIETYSFEAFKEYFASKEYFVGQISPPVDSVLDHIPKGLDNETKEFLKLNNFETVFDTIATKSMEGRGCNQVKHCIENAATLPYDLWYDVLSIARACSDWEQSIHELSKEHPEYNPQTTLEQANEAVEFAADGSIKRFKPHSCKVFDGHNPGICGGCPHRGKITNPLFFGKQLREDVPTAEEDSVRQEPPAEEVLKLPAFLRPYFRGKDGGLYYNPPKTGDDDDDDGPILLTRQEFWPVKRMFSPADGECLLVRVITPLDPMLEFTLPMKYVYALDKLKEALASNSIKFNAAITQRLSDYLIKWSEYLMNVSAAERMRMQMGWTDDKRGFVLGQQELRDTGEVLKTAASPMINAQARLVKTVGSYDLWKFAANKLNLLGFEMHAFGMLVGFGSPLMHLTSTSGASICYTGSTGNAKTGALYAAISIFGNPKELSAAGEEGATSNALVGWYLALKNIVFGLDEASNKKPEHLSELVHKISQGKVKWRMHSTHNAVRDLEFNASLIAFMTSNQCLYDKLTSLKSAPEGEVARLIEFHISRPPLLDEDPDSGKAIFDTFRTNYGFAVYDYINQYFKTGEDGVRAIIDRWSRRFRDDFGTNVAYRFYENVIGCCMAGGELANDAKIVNFDLDRIYNEVLVHLIAIRDNTVKLNRPDYKGIVGDFFNRYQGGVLIVDNGRVISEPRSGLVARADIATGLIAVSKADFKKFLSELQISRTEFEKALALDKILVDSKGKQRLSSGWSGGISTPVNVYVFKIELPEEWLEK